MIAAIYLQQIFALALQMLNMVNICTSSSGSMPMCRGGYPFLFLVFFRTHNWLFYLVSSISHAINLCI